jgi:hypothetical protein
MHGTWRSIWLLDIIRLEIIVEGWIHLDAGKRPNVPKQIVHSLPV